MNDMNNRRYLLHVSDFHLTDEKETLEYAKKCLNTLVEKLQNEGIRVDYLIHTGDIIDSSDLYKKVAEKLSKKYGKYKKYIKLGDSTTVKEFDSEGFRQNATNNMKKQFDVKMEELIKKRFKAAEEVMQDFISELNVAPGNVVVCCGNHDILRPFSIDLDTVRCCDLPNDSWEYKCNDDAKKIMNPFEDFLDSLNVANSQKRCKSTESVSFCTLGNMQILILNTNWINHKKQKSGYYCIRCDQVISSLNELNSRGNSCNVLSVVLAHKPIYEICEKPRLPYKRYIKTPFMSSLQKYIGDNGIYLCGDKHTRSIVDSTFHNIKHYIGGEPLHIPEKEKKSETEYNLLEISKSNVGIERKVHLVNNGKKEWHCEIRPQDTTVSNLYELSRPYISEYSFKAIAASKSFYTWDSLCQEIHGWNDDARKKWADNLNDLFSAICKYRKNGLAVTKVDENIFDFVLDEIKNQMKNESHRNVLNIRGEYDAGKSTFLGLLYIYLLYQYGMGEIDFIPAYFNLENNKMYARVENHNSYYEAARNEFKSFAEEVQKIAYKEDQRICYIIDGQDEQDCWSYSSQDSIGRGILDVLAEYNDSWYIMSFSQHRLPCFKNTMPVRKFSDSSDIMYFNPVDVQEYNCPDKRFASFVGAFLKLMLSNPEVQETQANDKIIETTCNLIRKFRRLTINPGFMYQNAQFITELNDETKTLRYIDYSFSDIYKYYIDRQEEICLAEFGYGFVDYAPAMAYLFAFKGYTYERFKNLSVDKSSPNRHIFSKIANNRDKVYRAFLFIKKHSDAREYLIALHYNRELRYYAENPAVEISEDSILNEFITRNISVLIRKLWSDTNKFVIVCNELLRRERLSNCVQSMLIYCLAHMEMYKPIRDLLWKNLWSRAEKTLSDQYPEYDLEHIPWIIKNGDSSEKLRKFIDLSLLHTLKIFEYKDSESSLSLAKKLFKDQEEHKNKLKECMEFSHYNRQYQMLYYGDLFIHGEHKQRLLDPDGDKVDKGFDFHNCYHYLFDKLNSGEKYFLREFDMFTLLDLITTRISSSYLEKHCDKSISQNDTFFQNKLFFERADNVIAGIKRIIDGYREEEGESSSNKFIFTMADKINEQWNSFNSTEV